MMTWKMVNGLLQAGHFIGSHTLFHPNLAYISKDDLKFEVTESKNKLEEKLNLKIRHFSYPNPVRQPHFNSETMEAVQAAGYKTAVTSIPGVVRKGDNILEMKRIAAPRSLNEFIWKLESVPFGFGL